MDRVPLSLPVAKEKPMNVSLPPTMENFIRERVIEDQNSSAEEVIREGLWLLMDREEMKAQKLAALREKIQIGLDQVEKGETVGMDEVFEEVDAIIANAEIKQA